MCISALYKTAMMSEMFQTMALALLVVACTKPNPRSCTDGVCSDPALPFCDVDGALGGDPQTCIAVTCTAGEFEACRDDTALKCNFSGNDYDVVQCEHGCADEASGCKGCEDSSQCANPSPFCDSANFQCRKCRVDDECASTVCDVDAGSCVAASEIVYASPAGTATNACTQGDPCSVEHAVELAIANPSRSTVRMVPGDYVASIIVSAGTFTIIGTGAKIVPATVGGHAIRRGSNVTIRGLAFDTRTGGLWCGGDPAVPASLGGTLNLRDLTITAGGARSFRTTGCTGTAHRVVFDVMDSDAFEIGDDSTFEIDQSTITSMLGGGSAYLIGQRINLAITNSVFDDVLLIFDSTDQTPGSTRVAFAFNTVFTSHIRFALGRQTPPRGVLLALIENNIIVTTKSDATDALICDMCSMSHNVVFPQITSLPPSNIISDPKLVAPSNHDFHLSSDSPAADAAQPSVGLGTDHDHDGNSRPQGAHMDVGAFERVQ